MTKLLESFVSQVIAHSDYEEVDRIYLTNRIMTLVGEKGVNRETTATGLIDLKDELVALAVENGFSGSLLEEQDIVGASLMDFITPSPSVVNHRFWQTYETSPETAIADFYQLSQQNDYVKIKAIAKNIYFPVATEYGELEITINLSKPEKDPKAIAVAKAAAVSSYPACQLCMENEGYQGRINHPARANHRIIRYQILGEDWGFQYSPYAYFKEHCIFLSAQHEPMHISPQTFKRLLTIVEHFPGYFVGSNTDLPIVGGSILGHEHYQGGRHTFPMEMAELEKEFTFTGFENIKAGIVKWPMSVIRLISEDKDGLLVLSEKILTAWRNYSDESAQILASSNGQSHHTVTPIARRKGQAFEIDIVLRDNQTSKEFPEGIYHPHPDVQHIKKENIGLIEVMGLAILPPRLKMELAEVEAYLLDRENTIADYHKEWANQLKQAHPEVTAETVTRVVQEGVGQVFKRVLEDAGVYKRTTEGQVAFMRFIRSIGIQSSE